MTRDFCRHTDCLPRASQEEGWGKRGSQAQALEEKSVTCMQTFVGPPETQKMSLVGILRTLVRTHRGKDREANSRSIQGWAFQEPKWPQIWNAGELLA